MVGDEASRVIPVWFDAAVELRTSGATVGSVGPCGFRELSSRRVEIVLPIRVVTCADRAVIGTTG